MLSLYFPVLVFLGIATAIAVGLVVVMRWINKVYASKAKIAPYECGFPGKGDARMPFDVRFYLVAILFIVFDLETAFLVPWAYVLRHVPHSAFFAMLLFLLILVVGFVYEWKKGALEWE